MNPNAAVVEAFVEALQNKDLSKAPLAETVRYESPLSPDPLQGRDNVMKFIGAYLPAVTEARVIRHIADGDRVATLWQAKSVFGELSVVSLFRIEEGLIVELQTFYDPRTFLEGLGTRGGD